MTAQRPAESIPDSSPPAWARAADLLCLGLLLLAAIATLSAGLRIHVLGLRLTLTSPYRLLLWIGVIALIRHVAAPANPAPQDLLRRFRTWRRRAATDSTCSAPVAITSSTGFLIGTLSLFIVLTITMTYPQFLHMKDALHDAGDPLLNLWAMSWVAHQLPTAPVHLFDANIFAPNRWTLAYSETLLAPTVVAAPLLWMGMPSIAVYNVVLLSGFVLSGVGAALLVRELTHHTSAAIVAGVIFAFLPFRFDHLAQLQLQQAEWIPLSLWAFHRTMRTGRWRDALWVGVFFAGQMLSCMYYGIFLAAYLVVVGGAVLLTTVAGVRQRLLLLAASSVLAAVLLAPAGTAYLNARHDVGERGSAENMIFSATWRNYLAAPAVNRLYGSTADRFGSIERRLFPGLVAVTLAAVALWPPLSTLRTAYLVGLAFAVDLTLGFNGLLYPSLYQYVTPFRALRIPALAVILVGLSLSVLAGFGVTRLSNRIRSPLARWAFAIVLCAGVLAESQAGAMHLTPIQTDPPAIYADMLRDIGNSPTATIVEVPMILGGDQVYMYYSTFHWQTLLNGYSGFFPPSYLSVVAAMRQFPDARSLAALRERGARYAVIHGEWLAPEEYRRLIGAVDGCGCGLTLVARRPWQDREISLYRLPIPSVQRE